ncbi:T9SS type A sorting domain-containing protein [Kordia sp.]|uniref:T9SS type A sorting domain-containing protein n=1 Tax=Kordia sp. TaxID=1965332 RepID=UPI003D2C8CEA
MKKTVLFYILMIPILGFSQYALQGDIIADAGGLTNDRFGGNSAMNASGDFIVISSIQHNSNTGKVQVYEFTMGSWTQVGSDIVGDSTGNFFGSSVAINADGSIIAVGVPRADGSGSARGYARVYENNAGTWTQLGSDFIGQSDFDNLGNAVDLSADGTKVAIAASGVDTAKGEVRVYEYSGASWSQLGSTLNGIVDGDRFGNSVNFNDDGTFLAIGIPFSDANGNASGTNSGQVKVYEYTSNWNQIFVDAIVGESFAFGTTVALSDSGNVLVASAPQTNDPANGSGFVRVYKYNGTSNTYVFSASVVGESNSDRFGTSVALSDDGNFLAVGAPFNDSDGTSSGKAYLYENTSGNVWNAVSGIFNNSNVAGDLAGISVSLSDNGAYFGIGAFNATNPINSNPNAGIVSVFVDSSLLSVQGSEMNTTLVAYPNPVTDYLAISSTNNKHITSLKLYDVSGRMVYEKVASFTETTIDLSNFQNGMYMLALKSNKETVVRKIIKQ